MLALFGTAVHAAAAPDVMGELKKQYGKSAKAFKARNLPGLMAVLAPDFTTTDPDGKTQTRDQMEALFKARMDSTKSIQSMDFSIRHLGIKGSEAIAETTMKMSSRVQGETDKKTHRLTLTSESVDTWIKADGVWKLRHVQAGKSDTLLDGKPYGVAPPEPKPKKPGKVNKSKKD